MPIPDFERPVSKNVLERRGCENLDALTAIALTTLGVLIFGGFFALALSSNSGSPRSLRSCE